MKDFWGHLNHSMFLSIVSWQVVSLSIDYIDFYIGHWCYSMGLQPILVLILFYYNERGIGNGWHLVWKLGHVFFDLLFGCWEKGGDAEKIEIFWSYRFVICEVKVNFLQGYFSLFLYIRGLSGRYFKLEFLLLMQEIIFFGFLHFRFDQRGFCLLYKKEKKGGHCL